MPLHFRSISGLDNARIAGGLSVAEVPGEGGAGPNAFIYILSASGLVPGTGTIEITAPTDHVVSASGADSNGNLSCSVTWVNTGNDQDFVQSGGGSHNFPGGFWNTLQLLRGSLSLVSSQIGIDIQFSDDDVISFTQDLNDSPDNPTNDAPNWNGDQGTVDLHFDITSTESPDSIAVVRDGVVIAAIPYTGNGSYTYTDIVFATGDYDYEFFAYKYANSRSAATSPITVSFSSVPSITMTMSGGIEFGGAAIIVFLGNPTGTYTIIKDKTNDTLYNSDSDVAIPNPFIETGFFPQ